METVKKKAREILDKVIDKSLKTARALFENKKFVFAVVFIGVIYLYTNFCIMYGETKERKNKVCLGVYESRVFDQTLTTTKDICEKMIGGLTFDLEQCKLEKKNVEKSFIKYKAATSTAATTTLIN